MIIPDSAKMSIQKTAPGPPNDTAVATPTMLPIPTLPAKAVVRAEKEETPFPSGWPWERYFRDAGNARN